ncbi:hypothetical protein TWF788_000742 [Orbilia oligospora]|uniref:Uncharacterized protein n=1 Tax=Orbilia oligospora TaxID=2813651 RepID=A0A7C8PGP3_ORBOL|nr:hypothetical protein TWF788_000742 [Orbilia oligospora]
MDPTGRRTWVITPSPTKPGTVVIASHWLDSTEPQGWVPYERLVSTTSSVRWVDVKSMYDAGEYNSAGDFENWSGDAEHEGKPNPAHWGFSVSTLNLDGLQPDSFSQSPIGYT